MRATPDFRAHEAGGATVLVVGACAVVLALALILASVVSAVRCAAQARAAADLGALAAADALLDGVRLGAVRSGSAGPEGATPADPCAVAGAVAVRNGARLESCVVDSGVNVTVAVSVRLRAVAHRIPAGQATATARAGPAPASR